MEKNVWERATTCGKRASSFLLPVISAPKTNPRPTSVFVSWFRVFLVLNSAAPSNLGAVSIPTTYIHRVSSRCKTLFDHSANHCALQSSHVRKKNRNYHHHHRLDAVLKYRQWHIFIVPRPRCKGGSPKMPTPLYSAARNWQDTRCMPKRLSHRRWASSAQPSRGCIKAVNSGLSAHGKKTKNSKQIFVQARAHRWVERYIAGGTRKAPVWA